MYLKYYEPMLSSLVTLQIKHIELIMKDKIDFI